VRLALPNTPVLSQERGPLRGPAPPACGMGAGHGAPTTWLGEEQRGRMRAAAASPPARGQSWSGYGPDGSSSGGALLLDPSERPPALAAIEIVPSLWGCPSRDSGWPAPPRPDSDAEAGDTTILIVHRRGHLKECQAVRAVRAVKASPRSLAAITVQSTDMMTALWSPSQSFRRARVFGARSPIPT
jgi:hypothetical protein